MRVRIPLIPDIALGCTEKMPRICEKKPSTGSKRGAVCYEKVASISSRDELAAYFRRVRLRLTVPRSPAANRVPREPN